MTNIKEAQKETHKDNITKEDNMIIKEGKEKDHIQTQVEVKVHIGDIEKTIVSMKKEILITKEEDHTLTHLNLNLFHHQILSKKEDKGFSLNLNLNQDLDQGQVKVQDHHQQNQGK